MELSGSQSNMDAVSNSLLVIYDILYFLFFLLVRSRTIGELLAPAAPFDKKCGRENWTVAFAPDGSYFAWSQGHRAVKLVPWSQCLKNL